MIVEQSARGRTEDGDTQSEREEPKPMTRRQQRVQRKVQETRGRTEENRPLSRQGQWRLARRVRKVARTARKEARHVAAQ